MQVDPFEYFQDDHLRTIRSSLAYETAPEAAQAHVQEAAGVGLVLDLKRSQEAILFVMSEWVEDCENEGLGLCDPGYDLLLVARIFLARNRG